MSPTRPDCWTISAIAQEMLSRSVAAVFTLATDFDDRPRRGETRVLRCFANAARQVVIVDVHRLSACIANQEDAVVQAAWVLVRDVGVGAFHAPREVGGHEEVEDPIHAVGGDAPALRARDGF